MATRRNNVSFRRVAWQDSGMDADAGFLGQLGPSLAKVLPMLDERSRRLVLGMAADAEGKGGGRAGGPPRARPGRGGGGVAQKNSLPVTDPGLVTALEELIRDASRGD